MLNGLDLFSGIGGIALALAPWVKPITYCEIDRFAQSVLLSRMANGSLAIAPIWDDIRSFNQKVIGGRRNRVDIITGGFPCQDISLAGKGAGLGGERSGLFWEIVRLTSELRPRFVFLENVPAITTRGGCDVVGAFTAMGYDCRWCVISAASVGAPHKRDRWFLLAYANSGKTLANAESVRRGPWRPKSERQQGESSAPCGSASLASMQRGAQGPEWWAVEPDVGRVAHGIPCRVDRIKCLGNAVVPLQARTAFKILVNGGTHP